MTEIEETLLEMCRKAQGRNEAQLEKIGAIVMGFSKSAEIIAQAVAGCQEQVKSLTTVYERHINSLESNRDEIAKQNTMLIELVSRVVGASSITINK